MRKKYLILASCVMMGGCFSSTQLTEKISADEATKRVREYLKCPRGGSPELVMLGNMCRDTIGNHSLFGQCYHQASLEIKGKSPEEEKLYLEKLDACYEKYTDGKRPLKPF